MWIENLPEIQITSLQDYGSKGIIDLRKDVYL